MKKSKSSIVDKVISIFLLLSIVLSFGITSVGATYNNFNDVDVQETVISYVRNNLDLDIEIKDKINLYNLDDNIIAFAFILSSGGYIISDLKGEIIQAYFEYTKTSDVFCDVVEETKIYYAGVDNYFIKKNSCMIDLFTGEEIEENIVSQLINNFEEISSKPVATSNSSSGITPYAVTSKYMLANPLATISYNPNNLICGSTAAAILLFYYDDYKDGNVLQGLYESDRTGETIIKFLAVPINGGISDTSRGATVSDIRDGLNIYFNSMNLKDYSAIADSRNLGFGYSNDFMNMIRSDKPFILIFDDVEGSPRGHFYVVHGILLDYGNGLYYVYCNNGYGSNNVFLSMKYACNYVVLNK